LLILSSGEYKCFLVLEIEKKKLSGMHWTEHWWILAPNFFVATNEWAT